MEKKFLLPEFGYEVTLGKFAQQADGAVWIQQGGTVVLSTVVSAVSTEFPGFLPLTVDYRQQFSAAGKIPGGYFKREGKFSDYEILVSRLIDRSIRPLFPKNYFDKLQVLATVYSVDKEHVPEVLSLLATSIALSISKIPFMGPIGAVEVARIDDQWITNPKYDQIQKSDVRLIVAGTTEGICMLEGSATGLKESEVIDGLFLAHEVIKKQINWQKEIQEAIGYEEVVADDRFDCDFWSEKALRALTLEKVQTMFNPDKAERTLIREQLKSDFLIEYAQEIESRNIDATFIEYIFDMVLRDQITDLCFTLGKRIDGRAFDEVRTVTTEVGLLPYAHGSALFNRGKTQILVSVTLGGGQDKARTDSLMGNTIENSYMLHYNFYPFSVGEVKQQRGPGRREIGHGHLASSAIEKVLPSQDDFSFTIRVVTDVLSGDGSTSQGAICGTSMALLDAGVPIKAMVSGVAMGLLQSSDGKFQVLTDIAGIEDALGLMDLKVAGTEAGITAIQMDIKYKGGLSKEIFEKAFFAALKGRLHIMNVMKSVMSAPRAELSPLVPKVIKLKVPVEKIGAIIGSGGKIIKEIIEKTGVTIDIEDDGTTKIFGHPGKGTDQAIAWVKTLAGQIERGMRFEGTIKRLAEFGIFVEIAPGFDGLIHVSVIPKSEQMAMMNSSIGTKLFVEVIDYDIVAGRVRLKPIPTL